MSGAYGYLDRSETPSKHQSRSSGLTILDGSGFKSSITVSLGGNNTPVNNGSTDLIVINPNTTSGNFSAINATTETKAQNTGFPNSAKNLNFYDVLFAVFSISLIILV